MTASLKQQLRSGRPAIGCWIELMSPLAAEVVARAGYDCVVIDLEHGPGSMIDAVHIMQAVQGHGCAPLIRVPDSGQAGLKRALDAGAEGCMVPSVGSLAAAREVVSACRFAPKGRRGMATSVVRASGFGIEEERYLERAAEETLVICQIETPEALAEVEAIADLDGVDMLFLGPNDLAASLGFSGQLDHPDVLAASDRVAAAARAADKLLGAIPTPARPAAALKAAGYNLVMADADTLLLRESGCRSVAAFHNAAEAD
ncbi:MAG: aldolase/citrate lyase family protein [Kiloniellales bacterium]|nr:aldolase/citrate lyase family protein [Kiloniellales bacterium]